VYSYNTHPRLLPQANWNSGTTEALKERYSCSESIIVKRFYTTDSGCYDSSKTVDGLFAVLSSHNNTSLLHAMSGSEQLSLNARCDNVAILKPFLSAHQATGHTPSCLNPTVVTLTILSLEALSITTGSSVAPKIDVALCHYGRQPSFFYFFPPYRRVDEWRRTAGDKDASFCYPSHSLYNLLVSGLVPPSSRCRTTLHSPSWVTRETEVQATSPPHETRHFHSAFCQKG